MSTNTDQPNPTIEFLLRRRSVKVVNMSEPGPSPEELDQLLRIATRVPDHGKLAPWRLITFSGESRASFGGVLQERCSANKPDADEKLLCFERDRFTRAPRVICVASVIRNTEKIPEWEQVMSAGAVCMNLLVAAQSMGYAAQWLTEWYAYDDGVKAALRLEARDQIAGFIYIGTAKEPPAERARPELSDVVRQWGAE